MLGSQWASPLPPDPPGREDIMRAAHGNGRAALRGGSGSPLPPDPPGREDIMRAAHGNGPLD
jgi:hypothetical protein